MTDHTLRSPIPSLLSISLLLILPFLFSRNDQFVRFAEGGKGRVHISDDLDDVVDDEEDEAWREWGKKSTPEDLGPPPEELSKMELSEIQETMMKHHVGPTIGFVKLRLGVRRTKDMVAETAMKWSKLLRTGTIEVKFMGIDLSTIMFTIQRGQDTSELTEFILDQEEAYEVRIGDRASRRPGDPPLEEVVESLRREREKEENDSSKEDDGHLKDEL